MTGRAVLHRAVWAAGFVAAAAWTVWQHAQLAPLHPHLVYLTGWGLLGLIVFLTAYNARKKLPFLPLLSSRFWLQAHLAVGLFTALLFFLHVGWRWPAGWFEGMLAALFAGVTLSGIAGWWLSRVIPKRLTTAGGEVLHERIPIIRRELRLEAEALVLGAVPEARATTLADFYARELSSYFAASPDFWANLLASRRQSVALLDRLAETKRYFTAVEQARADKLSALIRLKGALDFQWTSQLILKGWLFVHIPLTYGLLVFSAVHVVLVYAFSGGAR